MIKRQNYIVFNMFGNEQMKPSEAVLLKCMEMEWLDHFQTRNQTWKSLEIEAVLAYWAYGRQFILTSAYGRNPEPSAAVLDSQSVKTTETPGVVVVHSAAIQDRQA